MARHAHSSLIVIRVHYFWSSIYNCVSNICPIIMSHALKQLLAAYGSSEEDGDDGDVQIERQREVDQELENDVRETVCHMLSIVCQPLKRDSKQRTGFTEFRVENKFKNGHGTSDESSDSSSSSSSWDLTSSDADDEEDGEMRDVSSAGTPRVKKTGPKTKGEYDLDDLPKIEDLNFETDVSQLSHMGRVVSIMDRLVCIQSFKGFAALDLDSVLFSRDGHSVGSIFDVFGPVKEPRYLIRFNTPQEIIDKKITIDMAIFCAPTLGAPITSYVFTSQLMKIKGSDASWKHNNEPPEGLKEYSDDDEERQDKMKDKAKRKSCGRGARSRQTYNSPSSLVVPPNTPQEPSGHPSHRGGGRSRNWFWRGARNQQRHYRNQ